jgi:hypothetical protein
MFLPIDSIFFLSCDNSEAPMRILCAADAQFCSGIGGTLGADVIVSALQ